MVRVNSTNLFGISPYIVDTVDSNGSFTSIQAAINAASAAGGGVVYIRPGTYTEDLTFAANVDLVGADAVGFTSNGVSLVNIVGAHTVNFTGKVFCYSISFRANGASTIITSTAGAPVLLLFFCSIRPNGGVAINITNASCFMNLYQSQPEISTGNFCTVSAGTLSIQGSSMSNIGAGPWGNLVISGTAILDVEYSTITGTIALSNTARLNAFYSFLDSVNSGSNSITVSDTAVAFTVKCYLFAFGAGCVVVNAGASFESTDGFFDTDTDPVVSGAGTFFYGVNTFNNKNAITASVQTGVVVKPFASTTVRGVASFNPTYFTVEPTAAIVSVTGGGLGWVDQGASITVDLNMGNVSTANITLTLPAAPTNGDVCAFQNNFGASLVVQANAGQQIRLNASITGVGGTKTSAAVGDAIYLVYNTTASTWIAQNHEGTWV